MAASKKIRYIYDENGKKTDAIIPITKYEKLVEDLDDLRTIEKRKKEKSIPFSEVKKRLKKRSG